MNNNYNSPAIFYNFIEVEMYKLNFSPVSSDSYGLVFCPYYDGIKETAHSYMMICPNIGD